MNAPPPPISAEKIRVLHLIPWIFSGGVETRRTELARYLPSERFEQRIITLRGRGPLLAELKRLSVSVLEQNTPRKWSPFDMQAIRAIQREIHAYNPHIIHGAVFEGVSMAAIAGTLTRTPLVILEETSEPYGRSWRAHLYLATLARLADHTVGVSPAVAEYLQTSLRLPPEKISHIDNGVRILQRRPPEKNQSLREKWGIPRDAFLIGSVGRLLDSCKRFTDLITALSLLSPEIPDAYLIIVGAGGDLELLQNHARQKGVQDRVIFTDYQGDVESFYSIMDVFALLSAHEAFGLVVAEAMFCECPVVATRVGGMKSVVEDQKTGILVEPFQPEEAAAALKRLYHSPELRRKMGQDGRERAQQHYSSQRYARDVEALYLRLLQEKGLL